MAIELTPAKLAELKKKAESCSQEIWEDSISVAYTVTTCGLKDEAQFIAAADPAAVLAMVEEIESLNNRLWYALEQLKTVCRKESEAGQRATHQSRISVHSSPNLTGSSPNLGENRDGDKMTKKYRNESEAGQ